MGLTQITTGGVDDNINIDSNTLKVDGTNNRVGIGTSSPGYKLDVAGSIKASTQGRFGNGSAGSPSYAFDSDHDTGMYRATTNTLGFATSGSERLRIDSSGNLGIGTTSNLLANSTRRTLSLNHTGSSAVAFGVNGTREGHIYVDNDEMEISAEDNFMYFTAGSSERMRIENNGKIGIATTSPNFTLDVNGEVAITEGQALTWHDGSGGRSAQIYGGSGDVLVFRNTSSLTERMRIDSSGRLLKGITSGRSIYGINAALQIEGTTYDTSSLSLTCNNTNSGIAPYLLFGSSSGSSTGSNTALGNGGIIGEIAFCPANGTGMNSAAVRIQGLADGTISGVSDIPGRLVIQTVPDGSGSAVERFRIHSGGKLTVPGVYAGTTTGGAAVYVESDGDLLRFTSSLKYKTDIETIEDARADAILNCRPVWYRSKCENDIKTEGAEKSDWGWYGFIAEEVAEIEPRLVSWATKDAVEQENGFVESVERDPADYEAEGVRYDNFVPLLVNLVKRQQAAIETLEAKVAALEAK